MTVFRGMQLVFIADEKIKAALGEAVETAHRVVWLEEGESIPQNPDLLVDLLFEPAPARVKALLNSNASVIVVNSVMATIAALHPSFVRINAWPTFLEGKLLEASGNDEPVKKKVAEAFSVFGKQVEWLPDEPGFITPRVVCSIINEAFFALQENVSSKEDIDTALKLGTNYPYGPFEWAQQIGLEKVAGLLETLSIAAPRYTPCTLLLEEARKR